MKKSKTMWQHTRRILLVVILIIVGLSGTGFLYQWIASVMDASRYPPTGKRIDLGEYQMHLNCTGAVRPGAPMVILEAGLGDTFLVWSKVQPGVASYTRVCSYDRAGYGWSDPGPMPRTTERMVKELHALLAKAGIRGPYVLVGHSFGGLIMRLYATTYPQEVTGLVLVDTSHADQNRYPILRQQTVKSQRKLSSCQPSAPFGIVRLFGLLDGFAAKYPPEVQPAVKAAFYQTRFCRSMAAEYAGLEESFAQIQVVGRPLGDLPLVVLSHGLPLPDPQSEHDWQALQKDLASLSSNSTHIVATRSGHYIHLEQPDLIIAAIKKAIEH